MRESTLWFLHLAAAAALLLLLAIHVAPNSRFIGPGLERNLEFEIVASRGKSILYVVFYIALLGFVLYHANYGARVMLLELTSGRYARMISLAVGLAGLVAFAYGAYTTLAFFLLYGGG